MTLLLNLIIKSYLRGKFIPDKMTFGKEQYRTVRSDRHCDLLSRCVYYPPVKAHVVSILQPKSLSKAWQKFVLRDALGFTQHGVELVYVYCILGAQVRTRTAIVGSGGKSFDVQRIFQNLTNTSIDSSFNIGDSIKPYQDVLQQARSAVNYPFGYSLYMAPIDILLHIGDSLIGYNNKVIIAGVEEKLGLNKDLNVVKDIPVFYPDLSKTTTPQEHTQEHTPEVVTTQENTNKHETNKMLMLATAVGVFVVIDFLI